MLNFASRLTVIFLFGLTLTQTTYADTHKDCSSSQPSIFSQDTDLEMFPLNIGDQIVMLPFYEVGNEELQRLESLSDSTFFYNIPIEFRKIASVKDRMSPVTTQGRRGTCSVFASIALFEFLHPGNDFSEQCLAKFSLDGDEGLPVQRIEYGERNGLYYERDCPYDGSVSGRDNIPKNINQAPVFKPTTGFIRNDANMQDPIAYIKQKIDAKQAVVISVFVAGPGWGDANNPVIQAPTNEEIQKTCKKPLTSSNKKMCAGHAIVISGYNDDGSALEFKNSWGTGFGNQGYGRISYAYYNKMRKSDIISK